MLKELKKAEINEKTYVCYGSEVLTLLRDQCYPKWSTGSVSSLSKC